MRRALGLLLLGTGTAGLPAQGREVSDPFQAGAAVPSCAAHCRLVLFRSRVLLPPLDSAAFPPDARVMLEGDGGFRVSAGAVAIASYDAAGRPRALTPVSAGVAEGRRRWVVAGDGSRWAVSTAYVITHQDASGRPLARYQRRVQWFRRSTDGSGRAWRVRDFHVDAQGVLWVAMSGFTRQRSGTPRNIAERYAREPTYLEAIRLRDMHVLAHGTLPGTLLQGFLEDGRVYGISDLPGGGTRIDVWRPRLLSIERSSGFLPDPRA